MAKFKPPRIVLVNRYLIRNDEDQLLLIQRSLKDRNNPGLWEFPGGKLEKGQDLGHASELEVTQETGLIIEPISKLVFPESFMIDTGQYKGLPYVALFGIARMVGGNFRLSNEHVDHTWEPYDAALEYNLTAESKKALIVWGKIALS